LFSRVSKEPVIYSPEDTSTIPHLPTHIVRSPDPKWHLNYCHHFAPVYCFPLSTTSVV